MPASPHNPWPIALTVLFVVFAAGLASFIVYASTQRVDLVRADYYEEELRYQHQLDRLERTQQIGQPVTVTYNPAGRSITIALPAGHEASSGQIQLYRPSDARLDRHLPLALDSRGAQTIDAQDLRAGLWKVRVQWTAAGSEYYSDSPIIIRKPF